MSQQLDSFSSHPTEDLLQQFAVKPQVAADDISLHVASCKSCRQQVSLIMQLKTHVAALSATSCDESQQKLLNDLNNEDLSYSQKQKIRDQIKKDDELLKLALHTLARKPISDRSKTHSNSFKGGWIEVIVGWFQPLNTNGIAIAASIVLSVLITLFVVQQNQSDSTITIASYQDDPAMHFEPASNMPGIGFFSSATKHSEPYHNLQIILRDKQQLQIRWQAVDFANSYQFELYHYPKGQRSLYEKKITATPQIDIKVSAADYNKRFEWILSGMTEQQKNFYTTGGFILYTDLQPE